MILTMRRVDVGYIGVVWRFTSPQSHARRAAQSVGAEMIRERGTSVRDVLSHIGHVFQRVHVQVLVICEDKNDVGLLCCCHRLLLALHGPAGSVQAHAYAQQSEKGTQRWHADDGWGTCGTKSSTVTSMVL